MSRADILVKLKCMENTTEQQRGLHVRSKAKTQSTVKSVKGTGQDVDSQL